MRQIVLDTETTGLEPEHGHRIIEIGCVVLQDGEPTGESVQAYLDPERDIDAGATDKHGLTRADVARLSRGLRFVDLADDLIKWLRGAELIIHNAPFDVGFLDAELRRLGPSWGTIADYCPSVVCTVALSRRLVPGIKHSLDSVCDYYSIDRSHRTHHGALVDAELTALVYRALQNEAEHQNAKPHDWKCISPVEYDFLYECQECKQRHMESIDRPGSEPPKFGCAAC